MKFKKNGGKIMECKSIISDKRVKDLGEVFTPDWLVDEILDNKNLIEEAYSITSRVLEPSCGTGNFVIGVLNRKLIAIERELGTISADKQNEFTQINLVKAISNIYGIDVMPDNVLETKRRMMKTVNAFMLKHLKGINEELNKTIEYIIDRNIILGDALTNKMIDVESTKKLSNGIKPIFDTDLMISEWEFTGDNIKRIVYNLNDIEHELNIEYASVNYMKLHNLQEITEEDEIDI